MIKKLFTLLVILLALAPVFNYALADELLPIETDTEREEIIENILNPVIISENFIVFGKKTLFDASDSTSVEGAGELVYRWNFTDTYISKFGVEVIHEFEKTGIHKVSLTIQQGEDSITSEKEIFVYDKQMLMITDRKIANGFELIVDQAANNGVLLKVVSIDAEETEFLTEEKLVPIVGEEADFIKNSDALLFYTKSSVGLQAFARYWQSLQDNKKLDLTDTLLVKITDQNFGISAKLAQQSFQVIQQKYILLTRPEALNPIFETKDFNLLTSNLNNRAIEFRIIDARSEKSSIFFLSHGITNFISKGIPTNTVYVLLAVPFILFVIVFFRQIIGLMAFGVYTPLVITLTFFILGPLFGLGTLVIIIVVSYILRKFLNRFKLLYVPKTGLILSVIGLSFLGMIWFLSYYRVSLAISLAIFPMLVISTISERFLSAQSEEGFKGAFIITFNTIFISIVAYYLVVWTAFTTLIMSWPEIIILPILGIIFIGRFTGLRLNEYIRFRSLFKEKNIEE